MFLHVTIHDSVRPAVRTAALIEALQRRVVPAAFHYETPRQARCWLALHEAYSPARKDNSAALLYQNAGEALMRRLQGREILLIGLGCGSGGKDKILLQAALSCRLKIHYAPVDISLPLVLTAAHAVESLLKTSEGRLFPLVCDLTAFEDCKAWLQTHVIEQFHPVFSFFGMLPSLSPQEIRECLSRWLIPNSDLLLSANLIPDDSHATALAGVLPQYDNELTRQWLGVFLEDLGIPPYAGHMEFTTQQYQGNPPVWVITGDWIFEQSVEVSVGSVPLHFSAGERLRLFSSYRYTPAQVADALHPLGLQVVESWTDMVSGEGVFLCQAVQSRR